MRKLIPTLVLAALLVATAAPALANSGGHLEGYVPAVAHVETMMGGRTDVCDLRRIRAHPAEGTV